MITELLEKISHGINLEESEANNAMHAIMNGELTNAQIAGFLMGLKMKGETVDEIAGFVRAMRDKATKIKAPEGVIDTCGTGGDRSGTFNISTAAALVAAAAGVPVAKHGNRSVSSKCGSADVLQELGVKIDLTPEQAEQCLDQVGIAFLFAPVYHSSMKYVAAPRKEMGVRTVFNILGPMSNPARAKRQIIGAFNFETAQKMSHVLKKTGSEHVMVVHSRDGLDEISLQSNTLVSELKDGEIKEYELNPRDFGLKATSTTSIKGNDAKENAKVIRRIFSGDNGPQQNITALNAGSALYVSGKVRTVREGVELALETMKNNKALEKLDELVDFTNSIAAS
ncbi:MAG: anthranilate phosphoribosyltransferase [Calditrichaeota bacterium]|nr:anthranilate phosphoribosyltransferase [Calditrichota bacterium]